MRDQFRGCFAGLAIGERMLARGNMVQTELMQAVAAGYSAVHGFDPHEISDNMLHWHKAHPHADVPSPESYALRILAKGYDFERAGQEAQQLADAKDRVSAGCLPRVLPVALFRYPDNVHLIGESRVVCGMTHYNETCKMSAVCLSLAAVHLLLVGADGLIEEVLEFAGPRNEQVAAALKAVPSMRPDELGRRDDAVHALQAAMWAAYYCDKFAEAARICEKQLTACPLGTPLALALLGIRFGATGIPSATRGGLPGLESVTASADELHLAATTGG